VCRSVGVSAGGLGVNSGTLTPEGLYFSQCFAEYLLYEQDMSLVENAKQILVLTGADVDLYMYVYVCFACLRLCLKFHMLRAIGCMIYHGMLMSLMFLCWFLFILIHSCPFMFPRYVHVYVHATGRSVGTNIGTANLHTLSTQPLKERDFQVYQTPVLNELRGGDYHGLTKDQIKVRRGCCCRVL
jgi:hypothetical protein